MTLIDAASTLIDEDCGLTEVDGSGSLIYWTRTERLILPEGRNVTRVSFRPMVAITPTVLATLAASGSNPDDNHYYTGFTANTISRPDGTLSPIISAKGRYGYRRRGEAPIYPDSTYGINPLQLASLFGGPPEFTPIDVQQIDFNALSGEIWVPAGLYLAQYSEIEVVYNSGFDPRTPPKAIKFVTAGLVKNMLMQGGGATGLKGYSGAGKMSMNFTESLIDPTLDGWLRNYRTVVAR